MSKFLVGHTYKSRDGKTEYTVVADGVEGDNLLVTYVRDGEKQFIDLLSNGQARLSCKTDQDMMPNTVKHVRWINVYENYNGGSAMTGRHTYNTKQDALSHAAGGLIATVPVEWESEE